MKADAIIIYVIAGAVIYYIAYQIYKDNKASKV